MSRRFSLEPSGDRTVTGPDEDPSTLVAVTGPATIVSVSFMGSGGNKVTAGATP